MSKENPEKHHYNKKSIEGTIFKIIIVSLIVIVALGIISTQIVIERNMMVGDIEVLDLDKFFPNPHAIGIAFILIKPHHWDIEQNEPIYLAEKTINNENCYTCNPAEPVKVIYTTSYAFEIMNKIGIIENAQVGGTYYHPVENAVLLTLDQGEHKFSFDRSIIEELNRWELTTVDPDTFEPIDPNKITPDNEDI